jgi:hypothetical protein
MKKAALLLSAWLLWIPITMFGQSSPWNNIPQEAKPYTRWWWLGSAVDEKGLDYNLAEYAKAGIGGVEITPIYGVVGNEKNEKRFLSAEWMDMLSHTVTKGNSLGIETNMSTGTGWPFGGPDVPLSQAACKAIIQSYDIGSGTQNLDISCTDKKQKERPQIGCVMCFEKGSKPSDLTSKAVRNGSRTTVAVPAGKGGQPRKLIVLYIGRTQQAVKRAAPGGEGYVIDHFDREAVKSYLAGFSTAFLRYHTPYPHTFFNDSYEVYGADWTPRLFDEFEARRGYRLQDKLDLFAMADTDRTDEAKRVMSDYRETLSDLLLENFTEQWTDWAHKNGAITRNQAHGSPANLIDLYAAVDIPECEGFGLSEFGIKGLRKDPGFTKKNDSEISMLKYASSGAHISGKTFTSSETFTWLTEHFRTSLSQCKPDLDLMFVSGINHVFFHGSCYSPEDAEWPGWRFYASVDMTPANPQWDAMPAFSAYIQRCQAFLQWGKPDNDFLVYLPFYDMIYDQPGTVAQFAIHDMGKRAPKFVKTIQTIIKSGYDVDYISDRYISKADTWKGVIRLKSGVNYDAIIIPDVKFMPLETLKCLQTLSKYGGKVVFVGAYPKGVPGIGRELKGEQAEFDKVLAEMKQSCVLASSYDEALKACGGRKENMRDEQGLSCIRRSNEGGYHYFISNLQDKDVDAMVELGVEFQDAVIYNPLTGEVGGAENDGRRKVRLQLASGESLILRTHSRLMQIPGRLNTKARAVSRNYNYNKGEGLSVPLTKWTLSFPKATPTPISKTFTMETAKAWTTLGDAELNQTMATGRYTTHFKMKKLPNCRYVLDLGDVRESARVVVNGKEAGTLFCVPFRLDISSQLQNGKNQIDIYVTNLPANRIAQMDREGKEWRVFKEINVVDLNYKKNRYDTWEVVPSGLNTNPVIVCY